MRSAIIASLVAMALAAPAPPSPPTPPTPANPIKLPFGGLTNLLPKNPPAPGAASCNVQSLSVPAAPTPLPSPPAGSVLGLVAIGKGTQNYTCADSSVTTKPVAVGALATLYNASCIAASFPSMLDSLTSFAFSMPSKDMGMLPSVGEHYFADSTTPTFAVNSWGTNPMAKNASSPPPSDPTTNVAWLYLNSKTSAQKVVAVYRVDTDNGMAPSNCSGTAAGLFTVPYTAQYWMYVTQ